MPDISMCEGGDCPSKHECYRFTATPDSYQAYMDFNAKRQGEKCDSFLEIWRKRELREDKP